MMQNAKKSDPNGRRRLLWVVVPFAGILALTMYWARFSDVKEDIVVGVLGSVFLSRVWGVVCVVNLLYTATSYGWRRSGPAAVVAVFATGFAVWINWTYGFIGG